MLIRLVDKNQNTISAFSDNYIARLTKSDFGGTVITFTDGTQLRVLEPLLTCVRIINIEEPVLHNPHLTLGECK